MKNLAAVVGSVVALLLLCAGGQAAEFNGCVVKVCGTEHGDVTESCVAEDVNPEGPGDVGVGSGAGLMPGSCKQVLFATPCEEIPTCIALFARRGAPVLGTSALLLSALTLGVAGTVRLRRKSQR